MPVKLNARGLSYAKGRINRGKVDYDGEWSLSDDEKNALFADGIERYGEWHLGRDTDADEGTVNGHVFCYGKGGENGKVSRAALGEIVKMCRSQKKKANGDGYAEIEASAKELSDLVDSKLANSKRCYHIGPKDAPTGVILVDTTNVLDLAHPGPDMVSGGGKEGWTQICKTGKFLGHWQGPFEVTDDDLAVMVENFNRFVNALLFDYGHDSVWNTAAIASGWGHEMDIGKGGDALYSNTEWTEDAAGRIQAGEFKYISPVIMFNTVDPYSGEDIGPSIWTVALLNTPFLDGMDPVEIGAQIAASRQRLNGAPPHRQWAIPQASTPHVPPAPPAPEPAPVVNSNKPGQVPEPIVTREENTVDRKQICAALGLPETATDTEITAAIEAAKNRPAVDAKKLEDAKREADEAKALAKKLEDATKARELADAQALVESYVKVARIAPASRDQAVELALHDRASFLSRYGAIDDPRPAVVPMGSAPGSDPSPTPATPASLTPAELAVCAAAGITPEAFAKERDRRAAIPESKLRLSGIPAANVSRVEK